MKSRSAIRSLLLLNLTLLVHAAHNVLQQNENFSPLQLNEEFPPDPEVKLPRTWEVLGPFPIGSREVGADPLSAYGGFETLKFSETAKFPSELADEGYVTWKKINTNYDESVGPIDFENVRWEFNQQAFGWIALHHVIYFRGNFTVEKEGVYLVHMNQVSSFKIDSRAFVGNLYDYDHVSQSAIYLAAGVHTVYVQTVLDIRIFGGATPPKVRFTGGFTHLSELDAVNGVVVFPKDNLFPEIMNNDLITSYASVTVMNANVDVEGPLVPGRKAPIVDQIPEVESELAATIGWVQILDVDCEGEGGEFIPARIPTLNGIKLAPGQPYPVPLEIMQENSTMSETIKITLHLMQLDSQTRFSIDLPVVTLLKKKWGDAYKITFVDYDGSVQYAMAKPPKNLCSSSRKDRCPIVLALHGSGVEAYSDFWLSSYHQQDEAWVLYPTGRTTWGFDWHGPSFMNIQEALDALAELPGVPEGMDQGMRIDKGKLLYSGHSNGGQGAWWLVSHYPDFALGAMPAAGYMKIQTYTAYYLRVGDAFADPTLRGILEASISENDIDLYSANLAGIPILARSGGSDDNVPPMHTRRMIRLVNEWARDPISASISEVATQGHWFDGVMNDDIMQQFLDAHLKPESANPEKPLDLPELPHSFTLSTLNPGSSGTKGGIRILQLEVPFRLGQIRVHQRNDKWVMNTTNVRRFGFVDDQRRNGVSSWVVDGTEFAGAPMVGPSYVRKDGSDTWTISTDLLWLSKERHPSTYGPAINILSHPFLIVIPSNPTKPGMGIAYRQVAQHIATSWYLYGKGGTQIVRDIDVRDGLAARYNMIVLGGPEDNAWTRRREKEGTSSLVQFLPNGFQISNRKYEGPGIGIIFIAPSPTRTRMGLFIAGTDHIGFMRAAWTIPFRTGLMVPDYMIFGDEYGDPSSGWTAGDGSPFGGAGTKGAGGLFAAGYWNNTWEYDHRCGYLK